MVQGKTGQNWAHAAHQSCCKPWPCSPAAHQLCQPGSHTHPGLDPGGDACPRHSTAPPVGWALPGFNQLSAGRCLPPPHLGPGAELPSVQGPAPAAANCGGALAEWLWLSPIPTSSALLLPLQRGGSPDLTLPTQPTQFPGCHPSPLAGTPWAAGAGGGIQLEGAATTVRVVTATARLATEGNWPPPSSCLSAGGDDTEATPLALPGSLHPGQAVGQLPAPAGDRQCWSPPGCCCC